MAIVCLLAVLFLLRSMPYDAWIDFANSHTTTTQTLKRPASTSPYAGQAAMQVELYFCSIDGTKHCLQQRKVRTSRYTPSYVSTQSPLTLQYLVTIARIVGPSISDNVVGRPAYVMLFGMVSRLPHWCWQLARSYRRIHECQPSSSLRTSCLWSLHPFIAQHGEVLAICARWTRHTAAA